MPRNRYALGIPFDQVAHMKPGDLEREVKRRGIRAVSAPVIEPPTPAVIDFEWGCDFCGHRECGNTCCWKCDDPRCPRNQGCAACQEEFAACREIERLKCYDPYTYTRALLRSARERAKQNGHGLMGSAVTVGSAAERESGGSTLEVTQTDSGSATHG